MALHHQDTFVQTNACLQLQDSLWATYLFDVILSYIFPQMSVSRPVSSCIVYLVNASQIGLRPSLLSAVAVDVSQS